MKIKRALISCTDKSGLIPLATILQSAGVEILSTGGTAKILREAGLTVIDVSTFTGSPEILEGRVKTLHPKVHGGLLGKRDSALHREQMLANGIQNIDLVIVNLYAFEKTIAQKDVELEDAIENIDIGGPSMLRSAAKNYQDVVVLVDPNDYETFLAEMKSESGVSYEFRQKMAIKVFETTAYYDAVISDYLRQRLLNQQTPLTANFALPLSAQQQLRYGENPHQKASFYKNPTLPWGLAKATFLQGKELSYNNILDTDSAYQCVLEFDKPASVIVKHLNPCGVAIGNNAREAFLRSKQADPASCFGGIVALNRSVDADTAKELVALFLEVVVAPEFTTEALEILGTKKNLRVLAIQDFFAKPKDQAVRSVAGGMLIQDSDQGQVAVKNLTCVTQTQASEAGLEDADFAWKVVKHVKSNAIVFAKEGQTRGIGAGQMSRVESVKIACAKAKEFFGEAGLSGVALASDAFFPFRDGLDVATSQGIAVVVQPGGSVKDAEVIQSADEAGVAMYLTGMRHFKH